MITDTLPDTPPVIVDIEQLLRLQLKQWIELNRLLSEQNAKEPYHERANDITYCQAKVAELEMDILQLAHHLE